MTKLTEQKEYDLAKKAVIYADADALAQFFMALESPLKRKLKQISQTYNLHMTEDDLFQNAFEYAFKTLSDERNRRTGPYRPLTLKTEAAPNYSKQSYQQIYDIDRTAYARDASALKSWVFTLALSKTFNALKSANIDPLKQSTDIDEKLNPDSEKFDVHAKIDDTFVTQPQTPEEILQGNDIDRETTALINYIKERAKTEQPFKMFLLHKIQEISQDEISQMTGTPLGTVKSGNNRAKTHLAKAFKNGEHLEYLPQRTRELAP